MLNVEFHSNPHRKALETGFSAKGVMVVPGVDITRAVTLCGGDADRFVTGKMAGSMRALLNRSMHVVQQSPQTLSQKFHKVLHKKSNHCSWQ